MHTRKTSKTERTFIESSIELISVKGIKGTSIRDIANATGMSISNIYHYFGSKEGLLIAILKYSYEPILIKMKEISELQNDPLESLKLIIRTHILDVIENRREALIASRFMNEVYLSDKAQKINRELQNKILQLYLRQLRPLKQLGYLRDLEPTLVAFNIIGIINWFTKWYKSEGPLSLEKAIQQILSFVFAAIQKGQIPGN